MFNMISIPGTAVLLLASQVALTVCQPYGPLTNSALESEKATPNHEPMTASIHGEMKYFDVRDIDRVILVARDTTTTSETTTSTTSTSASSDTSTITTSSDTTTASPTSTSTTTSSISATTAASTSSTSTQSTTTSTSASSSSSSTIATSSTTTATASATSTTSAETAEWNRRGNIAAIVFGCCLISLFAGISIVHCVLERAKSKRIAARELLKASAVSTEPLGSSRAESTADSISNRSSIMFRDSPFGEKRPQTAYSAVGSASNGWARATSPEQTTSSADGSTTASGTPTADRQRQPLI